MTTLADLPAIIRRAVRTGTNVNVTGEPGLGKTSAIMQTVEAMQKDDPEFGLWVVYTPALSPTDFVCMMPDTKTNRLKSYHNAALPNAYDTPDLKGIVFLGERANGDPATNKVLQKYENNEDLGGLRKPKGVIIVADSNRIGDRSGTVQQSLALISRSRQINVDVDAAVTLRYFEKNGVNPYVMAYLGYRKEHVSTFDTLIKSKGYGVWANPRAWERLAGAMDDADANEETLSHEEIIGDIGEPVGREFIAFLHAATQLVSYDEIVAMPMTAPTPEKLSDVYAVVAMLSATTQGIDFPNVRKYVERFGTEVQVLYMRLLVSSKGKHKAGCFQTKAYKEWFSTPHIKAALL